VSGYCATPGPCFLAQRAAISRTFKQAATIKRNATRSDNPSTYISDKELDNVVDELFAELVLV
jgi:hypothetical protein